MMETRNPVSNALRALAGAFALLALLILPAPGAAQEPPETRFGLANAYQAPEAAAALGASWETLPLRWDELQPSGPGQWNISPALADGISAAVSGRREVVGVLAGTPGWATDGEPGTGEPRGLYLPANDPANLWAAFVRQAVNYGAARGINAWVIWDGQDIPPGTPGATWGGNVQDYYQLVKVAYVVARDANPNALVLLGGIAGADAAWFGQLLDVAINDLTAPANDYYFDGVTLHSFYSPERLYTRTQGLFAAMQQKGVPLKEVWITRMNARPAVDPAAYPQDATFSQHPNLTLEQQAAYVVQAYALGFAANRGARIALYRLVDDLEADSGEAYGLLREDGSTRPAYDAYQLVVREFSGFVFARRLDDETHPDLEYVRLTFPTRVTHVVWARGEQPATLVIPARSTEARLLDVYGNEWTVRPEGGDYRVAAGGALCNDPLSGCLIGGAPWLLVEEGLADPLNETAPPVSVEPGGTPLTAEGLPPTPTLPPAPTEAEPTQTPPEAADLPEPTSDPALAAPAEPSPTPATQAGTPLPDIQLTGWLPAMLIGAGVLVILAGVGYYFASGRPTRPPEEP